MSSHTALRGAGPPPLPTRERRWGVRPPPLPPPVEAAPVVVPPPLPDEMDSPPRAAGLWRWGAGMLAVGIALLGAEGGRRTLGDASRASGIHRAAPSINVPLEPPASENESLDLPQTGVAFEAPAGEVHDPLAPLADVIANGAEWPIAVVDIEYAFDSPHAGDVAPVESPREEDSPTAPRPSREDRLVTGAGPHISSLAPAACAGACPAAESRTLGTVLEWASSVEEAARQAREGGKLVFVIHVSGNFESPGFT
jgi:hypothetical protein